MDSMQTLLLLVVVFLVIIILFGSTSTSYKNECYTSFDPNLVDPYINPYSKDVNFRPSLKDEPSIRLAKIKNDGTSYTTNASLSKHLSMDDPMNKDPTKIFTHIEDQDMGLNKYPNTYDDTYPMFAQSINAPINMTYKPDNLSELRGVREDIDAADLANFSMSESLVIDDETDLKLNQLANNNDNDINGDCKINIEKFNNDEPYSDSIKNFPHMNIHHYDDNYNMIPSIKNMQSSMDRYKIFIKDQDMCPMFNDDCINNIPYENMHDVLNRHKMKNFDRINNSYRNIRKDIMYDSLN